MYLQVVVRNKWDTYFKIWKMPKKMNGTVWSIRPFKLVLTHFYQFIELNIFNSPCSFLLPLPLCRLFSWPWLCFFYGANFPFVLPPLSLMVVVCTYPVGTSHTVCNCLHSSPIRLNSLLDTYLFILTIISVPVQSRCLINICWRKFKKRTDPEPRLEYQNLHY